MPKICTKCHVLQDLTEFYRDKKSPDGTTWHCKTCMKAVAILWARNNPEKVRQKSKTRYEATGEQAREYSKTYYAAHPEERREYARDYRAKNPEKFRVIKMTSRAKHPETARAYRVATRDKSRMQARARIAKDPGRYRQKQRDWRQANPEKTHAAVSRRRARKLAVAINDFSAAQWREMKAAYGYRCVYCGKKFQRLTMDHIIALAKGGSHTASNIVPACQRCNSQKGTGNVLSPVQPLLLTIAKPKK